MVLQGWPPGGHSNRLSCCCNKVYFLLKYLVLCLRLRGWHRRFGGGGAGRAGVGRPLGGWALGQGRAGSRWSCLRRRGSRASGRRRGTARSE